MLDKHPVLKHRDLGAVTGVAHDHAPFNRFAPGQELRFGNDRRPAAAAVPALLAALALRLQPRRAADPAHLVVPDTAFADMNDRGRRVVRGRVVHDRGTVPAAPAPAPAGTSLRLLVVVPVRAARCHQPGGIGITGVVGIVGLGPVRATGAVALVEPIRARAGPLEGNRVRIVSALGLLVDTRTPPAPAASATAPRRAPVAVAVVGHGGAGDLILVAVGIGHGGAGFGIVLVTGVEHDPEPWPLVPPIRTGRPESGVGRPAGGARDSRVGVERRDAAPPAARHKVKSRGVGRLEGHHGDRPPTAQPRLRPCRWTAIPARGHGSGPRWNTGKIS